MKIISLLISVCLTASLCFSQVTLSLLNGKKLTLESYVLHEKEKSIEYNYKKNNGKIKKSYSDFLDIYSLNDSGSEKIFYFPEDEFSYSIEEMGKIVFGSQKATMEYKPWWAFVAGVAVGGSAFWIPSNYAKIIIPIGYIGGMAFVKPLKYNIYKRYPDFANDKSFIFGYQRTGRIKIIKNTTFGVISGIIISGITIGSLSLVK